METFTEPWQARENTFFLSLDGSCNINRYVLDLVYNDTAEPTLLLRTFFNDSQIEQERGQRKESLVNKIDISLVFLGNQYLMKQMI